MMAICGALFATAIATSVVHAAPAETARQVPANDAFQALEARCSARLELLHAGISKIIPGVREGKKAAFAAALEAEKVAMATLDAAQLGVGEPQQAEAAPTASISWP